MIEIRGLDNLERRIRDLAGSLRNTQGLWESIERAIEDEVRESIDNQKSVTTNQPFKPLSLVTQYKFNKGPYDALKPSQRVVSMKRQGNKFIFTTSMPYDYIHQYGNPNNTFYGKKAPIPARPFLPFRRDGQFTERFSTKLNQIIRDWVSERINTR